MLKATDKKFFISTMKYFFDVSGTDYEEYTKMLAEFNNGVSVDKQSSDFKYWLLARCFDVVEKQGIPAIQTCIEQKDMLRGAIVGSQSNEEGEFYTPEIWCQEGRKYLKNEIGEELWSKMNVWDCACGTGNLMRTSGHDPERLFLSTLLESDVELVKAQFPGATVFQLNATNGIDYDEVNRGFLSQLPEKLQNVFLNDEPLCVYINPPYKFGGNEHTDMYHHMNAFGFTMSAQDIQWQFYYRLCLLADTYKLSHFYLGIFGTTVLYGSVKQANFRDFFYSHFKFKRGFMFAGRDFADAFDSFDKHVAFTVWEKNLEPNDNKIILDVKRRTLDSDVPLTTGKQLIRVPTQTLTDWMRASDITRYVSAPAQTSGFNFKNKLATVPENALAFVLSENNVTDAVRSCTILSYTCPGATAVPITPENYWRCIVSFGARSAMTGYTFTDGGQLLQAPEENLPGYPNFVANCFALALFGIGSYNFSYRNLEVCHELWNHNNPFFPLTIDECKQFITDPVLIEDMQNHPSNNAITIQARDWAAPLMCESAKQLMMFGLNKLTGTLKGTVRKDAGYDKAWLNAYDASLTQTRYAGLWTEDDKATYSALMSKVRTDMRNSVYEFGIIENMEV